MNLNCPLKTGKPGKKPSQHDSKVDSRTERKPAKMGDIRRQSNLGPKSPSRSTSHSTQTPEIPQTACYNHYYEARQLRR
jgi:hypothetical protein